MSAFFRGAESAPAIFENLIHSNKKFNTKKALGSPDQISI